MALPLLQDPIHEVWNTHCTRLLHSPKKTQVDPKFAQNIPFSQCRPTLEHFLHFPSQSHHIWDWHSFHSLADLKGKEMPKTRGSQQELDYNEEFSSIKNQRSISLANRLCHSSKYNRHGQTNMWVTLKGHFNLD